MPVDIHVEWGSKLHERIVREADERFRLAEEYKRPREDKARKAYKFFRAWLDDAKYPFPTKIADPKFTADTMTQVAREMDSLFQSPPLLRFYPQGRTAQYKAQMMQDACAFFLDQMPLWCEMVDGLIQRRLFGHAVAHPYWRRDTRWMGAWQRIEEMVSVPMLDPITGDPIVDPMTGQPMMVTVPKSSFEYQEGERVTYEGPCFKFWHFCEWLKDPFEKYLQDGEFFLTREMVDKRFLMKEAKAGRFDKSMVRRLLDNNVGHHAPWEGRHMGERLEGTLNWQQEIGLVGQPGWKHVEGREWFELVTYWTHDGWQNKIVNGSYVMRRRRNPYAHGLYPAIELKNYHVPGEPHGMSDFELAERLYQALMDMRNAGATQALNMVFPPIKASEGVDTKQLRQRSIRDVWQLKDPTAVLEFMQMPQETVNLAELMQQSLRGSIDDILGLSETWRGGASGDTSASAITLATQGAGLRLKFHIDGVGEQFLKPLGEQWQHMIRQLLPHDLVVRITGDPQAEPMTIPIDELRDADFIAGNVGSTSQARMLQEKRVLEMYELIVRTQEPNANRRGAFEALVDTVAPERKNMLMRSEDEIAAEQQAMAAQQQQQEMGNLEKLAMAQEYAAQKGREADQREAVIRGAQAQGRSITELAPAREQTNDPVMEEMSSELGKLTESYL